MLQCTVISPDATTRYDDAAGVFVPAFRGEAEILPGHAEAFFLLTKGEVIIRREGKTDERVAVENGVCYAANGAVTVFL